MLDRYLARQGRQRIRRAYGFGRESGDGDLNARLASAGLLGSSSSVDNILERFREKPVQQLGHEPPTLTGVIVEQTDAERSRRS